MACENKQVVIGKKKQTCKQKIKNNIKNGRSVGHESRYCYTSQADRFCHKLPKKKKSKPWKFTSFFLSSRGCLYRTEDYILVFLIKKSAQKYHSVRGAFSCEKTIFKWLCFGVHATNIQVVYRVFFNHSCHLYLNYKETKIFHKNPFNKSTKVRVKKVTTLGKNWRTKLLFTMTSETNKHLSL